MSEKGGDRDDQTEQLPISGINRKKEGKKERIWLVVRLTWKIICVYFVPQNNHKEESQTDIDC